MKLSKYGITLSRLEERDIELVRNWRNAEHIRKNMEFQEFITPEMQKKWFQSIDNFNNFYYLISYKGEKIGLVNDKNIDWEKRCSEAGLFIGNPSYINSIVPMLVSITLLETAFIILHWNESYIRILKSNQKAIQYNKTLGYRLCKNQEGMENQLYCITRESFKENYTNIKSKVNSVAGTQDVTEVELDKKDLSTDFGKKIEQLFKGIDIPFQFRSEKEAKIFTFKVPLAL